MRKLLSIVLCLPLAACVIGEDNPGSGGDDTGPGNPPPDDGAITGLVSQDATWSGTVLIGYANQVTTRIDSGVTVTVAPGTVIKFKQNASLEIRGTLRAQGTSAQKIEIGPVADNTYALILNGTLDFKYVEMARGAIQTSTGSMATIVDTQMYKAGGDLLIMNGGTVNMSYSQIGPKPGQTDSTHCNIHTGGNANTISITHTNLNGPGATIDHYALMLYGGQNANFTNNNWFDNMYDVSTQPGVSADVSGSWFKGTRPVAGSGATLTANNLSNTQLADAGVRP
jgi:hypothetical protein